MRTVLIQASVDTSPSVRRLELRPGQQATFGRGCTDETVDLVLDDPAVSRIAGRIRAVEDYWTISNLSPGTTFVVENPEGGGEHVKVPPRRIGAPVPFEFARVVLSGERGPVSFLVFAPEHAFTEVETGAVLSGIETVAAYPMDETAKYFLLLVALCEPRLREPASPVIPTVPQLLERLPAGTFTRFSIGFHIDYLAREKLRVREPGTGGRADWQRSALVALALRFDLVRAEHLALLPRR
jgi:hypothetical protein